MLVFQREYTLLLWLNRYRKEVVFKFAIVCFDEAVYIVIFLIKDSLPLYIQTCSLEEKL